MTIHTITYDDATLASLLHDYAATYHGWMEGDYTEQREVDTAFDKVVTHVQGLIAAAPKLEAVSRTVPGDREILDTWQPFRDFPVGWIVDFARALLSRYGQPAESAEPPNLTDVEIEELVGDMGARWNEDHWIIEDADLHPMVRGLLYRYTAAPVAAQAPEPLKYDDTKADLYVTGWNDCVAAARQAQPAASQSTEREAFEAWAARRHGVSTDRWADSGAYKYDDTREWWECWQKARAALQGESHE